MNASSRFLASSQIAQNVRAIEDMRDLLLQEHSLTIKARSRRKRRDTQRRLLIFV